MARKLTRFYSSGKLRINWQGSEAGSLVFTSEKDGDNEPCCCCWEETVTFTTVMGQNYRECDPQVKETKTLDVPEWVCLPACAEVTWNADDDIEIDGYRLRNKCDAGGGTKKICIYGSPITLKLIDTVGVNWGGSATIKICADDCGCNGVTPPGDQGNCAPGE